MGCSGGRAYTSEVVDIVRSPKSLRHLFPAFRGAFLPFLKTEHLNLAFSVISKPCARVFSKRRTTATCQTQHFLANERICRKTATLSPFPKMEATKRSVSRPPAQLLLSGCCVNFLSVGKFRARNRGLFWQAAAPRPGG